MVLQDKYARAASRRYQKTHAPTPEQAAEHAAVDAAIKEIEKRRLGTNADRYKEDDEEAARAQGRLQAGSEAGQTNPGEEDEIDEEEEFRKAEEQAELEAFLERQRARLVSPQGQAEPGFVAAGDREDQDADEDVDHSFAHLRIGGGGPGKAQTRPSPSAQPMMTEEEREELRRMQDEARHRQAVRDLKDRFAGTAPRTVPPLAQPRPASSPALPSGLRSAGAGSRIVAPSAPAGTATPPAVTLSMSKPGVQPAAKGQDFLDTLL
ncbi:hypothetical protein JCM3774_004809 [Rhodotorula dairenensis]